MSTDCLLHDAKSAHKLTIGYLPGATSLIILGVRSPMVVEYEESCRRATIEISACVSVSGTPRCAAVEKVVDLADFEPCATDAEFLPCAFSPTRREELFELGCFLGLKPAEALVDPTAIVASTTRIGEASYVNAGVVIGAMSLLGSGILINRASNLGHHTFISDFVSIGPGVTLAGNIRVGRGAMVGAGSVIYPNLKVGAGAFISAGSVVRRDVPDNVLVAGNRAEFRQYDPRRGSLGIMGEE
jgi:carbonic anhydrase/acetyltransferase-like protein (isoleucine patch superfamily)